MSSKVNDNKRTGANRRRRTVKNAYVDVDLVSIKPGIDYCNWIRVTKQKLKERDTKICQIQQREIEKIVNGELSKLNLASPHFTVKAAVIAQIRQTFCQMIDGWAGVNIS